MKKITFQTDLSINQINNLKKQIEKIKLAYENGCENFVQYATQRFYELVCSNCASYNISDPSSRINIDYDKNNKIGKVYTNDIVVIFNEFGTGIKGTQDDWASKHNYQVNASGKGTEGWWYPSSKNDPNPYKWTTPSGEIRALTHGLESRHMFYDAIVQLQSEFSEMIDITIGKALGDLY